MNGDILIAIVFITTITSLVLLVILMLSRKLNENEGLKYEFVTIIAHKFRTPLTQVKWTTENLLENETDPYKKQSLTEIGASNEKLIKLTSTLVELTDAIKSTNSAYKFERLNICDMSKSAVDTAKALFHEKNIFVSTTCADTAIFVSADKPRMEFVLSTLLENACTYTPPGRNVSVNVSFDKKHAAISVTDDGVGIDAHDMPHMFTKFYRSKNAKAMDTEGMGIGLYLAMSIVKKHGGDIRVVSAGSGKGSTFSVVLPIAK